MILRFEEEEKVLKEKMILLKENKKFAVKKMEREKNLAERKKSR